MKNKIYIWKLDGTFKTMEIKGAEQPNQEQKDFILNEVVTHEKELSDDEKKEMLFKWVIERLKLPIKKSAELSFIESEIGREHADIVEAIEEEIKTVSMFAPYKMLESFK